MLGYLMASPSSSLSDLLMLEPKARVHWNSEVWEFEGVRMTGDGPER